MRLFDAPGADAAYDRTFNPPDIIDSHASHREENIFSDDCKDCAEEICTKCSGTFYTPDNEECTCEMGRLW